MLMVWDGLEEKWRGRTEAGATGSRSVIQSPVTDNATSEHSVHVRASPSMPVTHNICRRASLSPPSTVFGRQDAREPGKLLSFGLTFLV